MKYALFAVIVALLSLGVAAAQVEQAVTVNPGSVYHLQDPSDVTINADSFDVGTDMVWGESAGTELKWVTNDRQGATVTATLSGVGTTGVILEAKCSAAGSYADIDGQTFVSSQPGAETCDLIYKAQVPVTNADDTDIALTVTFTITGNL